MDVSENVMFGFDTACKVFFVLRLLFLRFLILFMPLANAFCHFRVKVAFVVKKVESLIHINNNVEEQLDTSARCERCRDHRHAKEFAELCIVDIVAAFFGFVEHVQGAHHAQVHIYELRGEVEVALDVACVNNIDYNIWRVLDYLLAYIKFLG